MTAGLDRAVTAMKAVAIGDVEREVAALEKAGTPHAVDLPGVEDSIRKV